jgi:hypothetical protein
MTSANPLSYNAWVQQVAVMAVVTAVETSGVYAFVDAPLQTIVPQILNYAELRIQRDVPLLSSITTNTYTITAGQQIFSLPVNDFFTVNTLEICQTNGSQVVNAQPITPASREMIQNCYSGLASAGTPQYFAMIGDNFGGNQDTNTNIMFGPVPNYAYQLRVTGTARAPSLYSYASAGVADTAYTWISSYLPDMLVIASMIYVSGFQRNWSAASADVEGAMSWEKQYQILRIGAISDENMRNLQGSAWTSYPTPTSATPTR